jgi:hypothetical protein
MIDIMRKEGTELDVIGEKKKKDIELRKMLTMENLISIIIRMFIFYYRNILFDKFRKIVSDDNQEDTIALLMFFNQS